MVQQLRREQRRLLLDLAKAEQRAIAVLRELSNTEPSRYLNARIDRIVALRSELDRVRHGTTEYSAVLKRILAESRTVLYLNQ